MVMTHACADNNGCDVVDEVDLTFRREHRPENASTSSQVYMYAFICTSMAQGKILCNIVATGKKTESTFDFFKAQARVQTNLPFHLLN